MYVGDGRHLIAPRDTLMGMLAGARVTSSTTAPFEAETVPAPVEFTWFHCEDCNALVQRKGKQSSTMPKHYPPRGSEGPCSASRQPYTGEVVTC